MRFAARPNAGERSCFLKQTDYFPICKERGVKDLRFNALAAPSFLSIESCRSTSFQQHIRWMLSGASIRSQPQHLHSDADHPSILPLRDTQGNERRSLLRHYHLLLCLGQNTSLQKFHCPLYTATKRELNLTVTGADLTNQQMLPGVRTREIWGCFQALKTNIKCSKYLSLSLN